MAKWCIVTGATSGIGRELALLAAADGFSLIVASRSGERLRSAADEFRRAGSPEVLFFPMDLSSAKAAQMLWAYAQEKGITPEILVNNAGFGVYTDAADADNLERVTRMMGLNVEALTVLSMLAAHAMREAGNGRILNVASVAAFAACPKLAAYAALCAFLFPGACRRTQEYGRHCDGALPGLYAHALCRCRGCGALSGLRHHRAFSPRGGFNRLESFAFRKTRCD